MDLSVVEFSLNDIKRGIKVPTEITSDVAYLSGILAGDGHISKDYGNKIRNQINCGGNPKDEKEFYKVIIKNLWKTLFNLNLEPRDLGDGTYGIRFESKAILLFFTKIIGLPRGKKYDYLKIPSLFLKDRELILHFIRGLFDTDFGFCLCKNQHAKPYYPEICFDSKSENFTKEIWKTLKILGLNFNGKVYRVYDPDLRTKAGYTTTYRFDLYGHKNLVQIFRIIGFRHPKHFKKFQEWLGANKDNERIRKLIENNSGG